MEIPIFSNGIGGEVMKFDAHRGPSKAVAALICMTVAGGVLVATNAKAWGNDGHRIVCAIAYNLLPTNERAELTRRTREYRRPGGATYRYYTHACEFADLARREARDETPGWSRFGRFESWHYLNVNRDTIRIEPESSCEDCILEGLEYHMNQSRDMNLDEWMRTEALFFIGHWVGDIHQPLHVSYRDDLGGNQIGPIRGGYYRDSHLHQVWDSGIISKARSERDWWTYALELAEEIRSLPTEELTEWNSGNFVEWAAESYAITTSEEADYCRWTDDGCVSKGRDRTLDEDYQRTFESVVEQRLMQAGVRLAALLEPAL